MLAARMDAAPILYIAGDVHLRGNETSRSPFLAFLARLAELPPAHLVLLGDLFEYWLETTATRARYAVALQGLQELRHRGWRLDLVLGNRELVAGRLLAIASGCRVHWPRFDVRLGPRLVRVVHGDRLCHDPHYHFFAAWMRSFWQRRWHELHPALVQDMVARLMRRRSRGVMSVAATSTRHRAFIDRRRVQASGRGIDTLIAGHIHQSWRRRIGGVDMMLVGDWPGPMGHWIEGYADGRLERVEQHFPA